MGQTDRRYGKGRKPPAPPGGFALRTRTPRRETGLLRANMARSQRVGNSGRTTTSPGLLTVCGRRTNRAAGNLLAGSRRTPGETARRTAGRRKKHLTPKAKSSRRRRKRQTGPEKSCIPPGTSWTRRRRNRQQRSRPGSQEKPSGSPNRGVVLRPQQNPSGRQENVGVEGAHKSELAAEGAARRLTRYAKRHYREHPARRVAKWERKEMKARADLDFQKMAAEHPELASSPLSRIQQKWKLKRKYAKEAKAAAKQSAKAAKKAAASTGSAAKRPDSSRPPPGRRPPSPAVVSGVRRGGFGNLAVYHGGRRYQQRRVRHLLRLRGR